MDWNHFLLLYTLATACLWNLAGYLLMSFDWFYGVSQNQLKHKIQFLACGKDIVVNLTVEPYVHGQSYTQFSD